MIRTALIVVVGLALAPLTTSALPGDAGAALRGQIRALQAAGFSGMAEVHIPQAPPPASALAVSARADETTEALAALSRAAQTNGTLIAAAARTLGFDFNDGVFPVKGIERQAFPNGARYFDVTTIRGKSEIVIQEFDKAKQELRSYLITSDGSLVAAAVTKKINGKFQSEKVAIPEARTGCGELLEFWKRYYRENLKKP